MTEYMQQIESGKQIVRGMLSNLASELREPKINSLAFKTVGHDFALDQISLADPKANVVTKIEEDDLADCPADELVCGRLEGQVRQAIQKFYRPKC
jgi:hypothetical protein